ncbi:hypothetical protein ACRAWD_28480 [Caulobacter segnis]
MRGQPPAARVRRPASSSRRAGGDAALYLSCRPHVPDGSPADRAARRPEPPPLPVHPITPPGPDSSTPKVRLPLTSPRPGRSGRLSPGLSADAEVLAADLSAILSAKAEASVRQMAGIHLHFG